MVLLFPSYDSTNPSLVRALILNIARLFTQLALGGGEGMSTLIVVVSNFDIDVPPYLELVGSLGCGIYDGQYQRFLKVSPSPGQWRSLWKSDPDIKQHYYGISKYNIVKIGEL